MHFNTLIIVNNNKAEAEPPPTFRWLDAENQPVTEGQVVNDQYKVFVVVDDYFDNCDDVDIIHQMNMITLIMKMKLLSTMIWVINEG